MKTNHVLISLIALLLISSFAEAQEPGFTFAKVFGKYVRVSDLAKDNSGNIYVTGNFNSPDSFFDFDPDTNFQKLVPSPQSVRRFIFVAKYSPAGRCLWAFNIGNASTARVWGGNSVNNATGTSIGLTASGDVIISGYYNGLNVDFDPAPGHDDLHSSYDSCCVAYSAGFIASYNSNGEWQWTREIKKDLQYGEDAYVDKMTVSPGGSIYAYGNFTNSSLNANTPVYFNPGNLTDTLRGFGSFIAKYSSTGSFEWVKRVAGINYTDMQATSDGALVLGGSFRGTVDFDMSNDTATLSSTAGSDDIFISKWNADGSFAFVKNFFSTGGEGLDDLEIDSLGNIYFTGGFTNVILFTRPSLPGFSLDVDGSVNFLLAKCNPLGEIIWAKRIASGLGYREYSRISLDPAGSSYITGGFNSSIIDVDPAANERRLYKFSSTGYDYIIVKYDNQGVYQWGFNIGGDGDDRAIPLAVGNNEFYLFGSLPFGSTGLDANPGEATHMIDSGSCYIIRFDNCIPTVTYYPDHDGDGAGRVTGGITSCILPYSAPNKPYSKNNIDCDDTSPDIILKLWYPDSDGDGFGSITSPPVSQCDAPAGYADNNKDCNDNNPVINFQTFYLDVDGDGYWTDSLEACSPPSSFWRDSNFQLLGNNDCNDNNPTIWKAGYLWIDNDNDNYSNSSEPVLICYGDTVPSGYRRFPFGVDCDDNNPQVWWDSTWSRDQDGDGFVAITSSCYSPGSDWTIYTGSWNNIDCDDTDSSKTVGRLYYLDADNDGFGNSLLNQFACGKPAGNWVLNGDDCNDFNSRLYPATWYKDFDQDGFGSKTVFIFDCTPPDSFWVRNNLDCNDFLYNNIKFGIEGAEESSPKARFSYDHKGKIPYIAYTEPGNRNLVIKKMENGVWIQVGPTFISSYDIDSILLKLDSNAIPYCLIFVGNTSSGHPNPMFKEVIKLNGTSWQVIGNCFDLGGHCGSFVHYTGFRDIEVTFDSENNLTIGGRHKRIMGGDDRGTVYKFIDSNWVYFDFPQFEDNFSRYLFKDYFCYQSRNGLRIFKYSAGGWQQKYHDDFGRSLFFYLSNSGKLSIIRQQSAPTPNFEVFQLNDAGTINSIGRPSGYVMPPSCINEDNIPVFMNRDHGGNGIRVFKYDPVFYDWGGHFGPSGPLQNRSILYLDENDIPYVINYTYDYKITLYTPNGPGYSAGLPTLSATQNADCSYTITVTGGEKKDASKWVFYRDSCGRTRLGEGSSVLVYPAANTSTNYYVRGESECVLGECAMITITTGNQPVYYGDIDGDGWYTFRTFCSDPGPQWSTTMPDNFAEKIDCDDGNDQINPGAPEICGNGIDDNCDGLIDERPYYTVLSTSDSWKTYAGSVQEVYKTAGYDDSSWLTAAIASNDNPICSPLPTTTLNAVSVTKIWHPYYSGSATGLDVLFRNTFNVTGKENKIFYLDAEVDDDLELWINGQLVLQDNNGLKTTFPTTDISAYIINGINTILAKAKNQYPPCSYFACRISYTPVVKFYADADGDGYGNPDVIVPGGSYCSPPSGATADNTDCDDNNYYLHETFIRYYDSDGDGYYATIKLCDTTGISTFYLSDNSSFIGPDCNDEDVTLNAPNITITNIATQTGTLNLCAGEQIFVYYNSCAQFSSSNLFQIQLSDKNGNFIAPYNIISSLNDASQTGAIGAMIPYTTEAGSNYRLRIVSTDAPITSQPNGTAIQVSVPYFVYRDADNDGFGTPGFKTLTCQPIAGYVTNSSDCNDNNAAIKPGATELCNGIDDDCDGLVDESVPPPVANAGADQTLCVAQANLIASALLSGSAGHWSIQSGGVGSFSDSNAANAVFYGTPGTSYILRWTVTDSCGSAYDELTVNLILPPTKPANANCWDNYQLNTSSCSWINMGTQPAAPTGLACYQTAAFNTTSCSWNITGSPITSSFSDVACGSYLWKGTTYTNSGSYTWVGTSATGCDSTVTLNLMIKKPSASSQTASACKSYLWNGEIYTHSGNYTKTGFTNAAGCDSVAYLNLTIFPLPEAGSISGTTPICVGTNYSFSTISADAGGSWSSTNIGIATVNGSGQVTGVAQGSAVIRYIVTTPSCGADTAFFLVEVNVCNTVVNVKAYLEGFYRPASGEMAAALFDLGESSDPTATDTIKVDLWGAANTSNATPDYSAKAVLHTNGMARAVFPVATLGNSYYIAIRHRNSIETWSANPVSISEVTNYNFSDNLSKAYNDGANPPMKLLASGKYGLYAGDLNQDGTADGLDMNDVFNDAVSFLFGYNTSDCDGDGETGSLDMNLIYNNGILILFYARP